MGCLTVTIVFLSDSSARPLGTKTVPNSIRPIMPVNILRYIVESPLLEIRASKFLSPRNSVHGIGRHAWDQTAWGATAQEGASYQWLKAVADFPQTAAIPTPDPPVELAADAGRDGPDQKVCHARQGQR